MSEEQQSNKTKWIVAGVIGLAVVGGGAALALSGKDDPSAQDWYGFQIRVEDRGLDEEQAAGQRYRWVLARGETPLATGVSESKEAAIDAAKSAAGPHIVPAGGVG
jgi:hypothetical protein